MHTRAVKSKPVESYRDWLKNNHFSLLSSRHRGMYAELIFKRFCQKQHSLVFQLNPFLPILDQIPHKYLKKSQQNELKKQHKIPLKWLVAEKERAFFVALKMSSSPITKEENRFLKEMKKNQGFVYRVYEDGEMMIKKWY